MASKSVGFRIAPQDYSLLEQQATLHNCSPGHHARTLLLEALHENTADQLRSRLDALESEHAELKRLLRLSTEAIMVTAASMNKPTMAEIKSWIAEHME